MCPLTGNNSWHTALLLADFKTARYPGMLTMPSCSKHMMSWGPFANNGLLNPQLKVSQNYWCRAILWVLEVTSESPRPCRSALYSHLSKDEMWGYWAELNISCLPFFKHLLSSTPVTQIHWTLWSPLVHCQSMSVCVCECVAKCVRMSTLNNKG